MNATARVRLGVIAGLALILIAGTLLWREGYFQNAQVVPHALAQAGAGSCKKSGDITGRQVRTVTITADEARAKNNEFPLYWKTWGSGDFSFKFRNCTVTLTDESSRSCVTLPDASQQFCKPNPQDPESSSLCRLNNEKSYYAQISCVSNVEGATTQAGTPLVAVDDVKIIVAPPSSPSPEPNEKLPEPLPPVKPRYREL